MSIFSKIWRFLKDTYLYIEGVVIIDNLICKIKINNRMILTPNIITLIRVLPGLLAYHIAWNYNWLLGAWLYGVSFWGDRLDGAVARRCDMTTRLGKYLDPAMDKLVNIYGMIFFLWKMEASLSSATLYSVAVIWLIIAQIGLLTISIVKLYLGLNKTNFIVTVEGANNWGKVKTVVECVAVCLNILVLKTTLDFDYLSPLYGAAGVLAVQSAITHIRQIKKRPLPLAS